MGKRSCSSLFFLLNFSSFPLCRWGRIKYERSVVHCARIFLVRIGVIWCTLSFGSTSVRCFWYLLRQRVHHFLCYKFLRFWRLVCLIVFFGDGSHSFLLNRDIIMIWWRDIFLLIPYCFIWVHCALPASWFLCLFLVSFGFFFGLWEITKKVTCLLTATTPKRRVLIIWWLIPPCVAMDQNYAIRQTLAKIYFYTNSGKIMYTSCNSFHVLFEVFSYCIPHCFEDFGKPEM